MMSPTTKINSGVYQGILQAAYRGWSNRSLYGDYAILIQDNAPAHSSKRTHAYFERAKITNLAHLKEGISTWWKTFLTVEECRKYIRRVQKQMRKVIEQSGGPVYD
ncbi:hypothetical protein PMAYCL1PPCAC_24905 [Pristionchus mayeri]|uniref:Rhodanese domain-containing protein n=1 Tax=Pristionchus mayeri TaxID=1317129 RepID=A0AAN5D263_9BILA|nr:hypothetical protein PMAYCL1PPCAC_24905 [Pristionchus mayeri]